MLKASGVADIIDLSFYPWGNAYYATDACGKGPYSSDERHCWFSRCVQPAHAPGDCFAAGSIVAQHGAVERSVNVIEACAIKHNPEWKTYWPFVQCMEEKYEVDAAETCAKSSGLDYAPIAGCAGGPGSEGEAVEALMAKATPDHPGVPYILVDGKEVGNPTALLKAVCDAYGGTKPAGCEGADSLIEQGATTLIYM